MLDSLDANETSEPVRLVSLICSVLKSAVMLKKTLHVHGRILEKDSGQEPNVRL